MANAAMKCNGRNAVYDNGTWVGQMKYVIVIIQSHRLENVREALVDVGVEALLVVEARRYGAQEEHIEFYRGAEYDVGFMPRTKIEFAVASDLADKATAALRDAAHTGEVGDGRIFVLDVDHSIQIRSGKVDKEVAAL